MRTKHEILRWVGLNLGSSIDSKLDLEIALITLLENTLHNHSLKDFFKKLMRELVPIPKIMVEMHGEEYAKKAEDEAADKFYEEWKNITKLRSQNLPPGMGIDWDNDTYTCEQDREVLDRIKLSIEHCNSLIDGYERTRQN